MLNVSHITFAGAPTSGVDEVQSLAITGTPTGGTFTLTFDGQTTSGIPYNATSSQVQTALEALSTIGSGNVACAGGALPGTEVVITFGGTLSGKNVSAISTASGGLTGGTTPTAAITTTTAGVAGTFRGIAPGCVLIDTTNGTLYRNAGTTIYKPTWTTLV